MKKNSFLAIGIATSALVLCVAAIGNMRMTSSIIVRSTDVKIRTLTLNHDNAPSGLPADFSSQIPPVVSATFATQEGNNIPFVFEVAKSSNTGLCVLANHGRIYNYGAELGRFKGITSIAATFTGGTLKFEAGNYELKNGGAYLDYSFELQSGQTHTLTEDARYFSLSAGDAYVTIESITIKYACDGVADEMPTLQEYVIDDFNDYDAEGVGWDQGHNYYNVTKMRSTFFSQYKATEYLTPEQTLDGSGWTLMGGSYDYMYLGTGRTGNAALLKVNQNNNFRYVQTKAVLADPRIIGKGNQLSVWMHSAYTGHTAPYTDSTQNVVARIFALYNKQFSTSAQNVADIAEYTIMAGSGWHEYKLDLDPSKEYYAYGICLTRKSTSATAYVAVDDVTIKTVSKARTNPSGTYTTRIPVSSASMPAVISFAEAANKVAVWINNKDASAQSYTYNSNTHEFTIVTTGAYNYLGNDYTYGNISGTWDPATDTLTGVTLDGGVSAMFSDAYSFARPTLYYDCEGDNIAMRNTFKRQYWNDSVWAQDTGNADRLVSNIFAPAAGSSSLSPRSHSSYRTGVALAQSIDDTTTESFSLWFLNTGSSNIKVNFTVFNQEDTNTTDNTKRYVFANDVVFAPGWSFWVMGFSKEGRFVTGTDHLRNFLINIAPSSTRCAVDSIGLYY